MGVALLVPFSFGMDLIPAVGLLLGIYCGGMYGGSISAITLNTPGTNSAIATTFDGYPLARKGKVKKALDVSLFASTFGGLFSALLLLLCAQLITKAVSKFTSVEYFALGIMGISLIAGVSGESLPKALISGMLGLLMACIGKDSVTGVSRYAFGSNVLRYGINILPAMIALIALMQVVDKLREFRLSGGKIKDANKIDNDGMTGKEIAEQMLHDNGIYDVTVKSTRGMLTDFYNPQDKTVNLSEAVYGSNSVAAAAVAAHECGHALQHAQSYAPLKLRSMLVPIVQFSSSIVSWILLAGIILVQSIPGILLFGIILFAATTLFSVITLPVEINASQRALVWLNRAGVTNVSNHHAATDALKAAAYTYVVAALSSLATLIYYITIYNNRR